MHIRTAALDPYAVGEIAEGDEVVPLTRVEDDPNGDPPVVRSSERLNDHPVGQRVGSEVDRGLGLGNELRVNPREVLLGGVVDLLRQGGHCGATSGQHGNRSSDKSRCPHGSPLEATPERRAAPDRRALHDDEAGALQMLDKPFRHDSAMISSAYEPACGPDSAARTRALRRGRTGWLAVRSGAGQGAWGETIN